MTKTWHEATQAAWNVLEVGGGTSEFSIATVQLALDTGLGPVRLARGPDGEPRLLIPTKPGSRLADGLSGAGVAVQLVQYIVAGHTRPFIEVSSRARELDEVFHALVDEILRRLGEGAGAERAVEQAIADFRELLARKQSHPLEVLVGLFGELNLLVDLLPHDTRAVTNWTGPLAQRFDFSGREQHAEVKTTLQRVGSRVHITSLDQLQPPPDGLPLVLVHTVLERVGAAGQSVRDLIQTVYQLTSTADAMDSVIAKLGLDDWRTNGSIASERFRVLRQSFYEVTTQFPRLSADSFNTGHPLPGVSEIKYCLDLAHADAFRLNDQQRTAVLRRIART